MIWFVLVIYNLVLGVFAGCTPPGIEHHLDLLIKPGSIIIVTPVVTKTPTRMVF
jgi:hypothetical protein